MMGVDGVGGGGGIDPPVEQLNILSSAKDTLNRSFVHMFIDTLQVSFTDLVGRPQTYGTNPDNPVLPPVATSVHDVPPQGDNKLVQEYFLKLFNELPDDLKGQFASEMLKPADKQSPEFAALNQTLMDQAEMLAGAKGLRDVVAAPLTEAQKLASQMQMLTGVISGLTTVGNVVGTFGGRVKETDETMESQALAEGPKFSPRAEKDLSTFLKTIADAISQAKEMLALIGTMDSEKSKQVGHAQMEMTKDKLNVTLDQLEKQKEAMRKQAEMKLIFQIVGPIVTAIMALVSVLTLGAATPLAIMVCVAMSAASVALSVADSVTGFMSDGIDKAMKGLDGVAETLGITSEAGKAIFKFAFIVVAFIVARGAAGRIAGKVGQSAAQSLAKGELQSLVAQVGKTVAAESVETVIVESSEMAVKKMITGMALQYSATFIAQSNVIVTIVKPLFEKMGMSEENAEIAAQIFQMIAMLAVMMANVAGTAKGMSQAGGNMSKSTMNMIRMLGGAGTLLKIGQHGYGALRHYELGLLAKEKGELEATLEHIEVGLKANETSMNALTKGISDIFAAQQELSELFTSVLEGQRNIVQQLWNAA